MIMLKVTEDYRAESEEEVKMMSEQFRAEAHSKGYILNSFSYTKKEKKSKGVVIDEGFLVKASKVYGGFWDGADN